jgi:endonuclease/exonuclease/phosphatase family metal-dependent hydrolase
MRFSLMTFNVRGSFHEDGANDWPLRRDLNAATLHKYAPDIIGFQEAQSGNLETYEQALSEYDVELGLISIRQEANYHRVPIYWKRDRFSKVDSGGFYLSETPEEWSLSWGSTLVRAATWVILREQASGIEFLMLNTHFPHEQETDLARTESARLIVENIREISGDAAVLPSIVTADFNAVPTSDAYQVFMLAGFTDSYTAAGKSEPVITFHGFKGADFRYTDLRIDWILTKDGARTFKALDCRVLTDEAQPVYPSDHYPVLAELELS